MTQIAAKRQPLTRAKVLDGALALADRIGIESLTIRRLAEELGVKPMTIYHYLPGKDAIIDGIVDMVFAEVALPPAELDWTAAIRVRTASMREVLARHPWAAGLMETRTSPGPASLRHHEAVLESLRSGGLPLDLTAHAYAIIDSFVYGFALQEATLPFGGDTPIADLAEEIIVPLSIDEFPRLTELTVEYVMKPGYAFGNSFDVGLDLILEGLARRAASAQ